MSRRHVTAIAFGAVAIAAAVALVVPRGPSPAPPAAAVPDAAARVARAADSASAEEARAQAPARRLRGRIAGRVIDAAGRPAVGAAVLAQGPSQVERRADEEGAFAFEGLVPGDWLLNARLEVRASDPLGPVPLGPGEDLRDLTLVLDLGAALSGTVRDARDGAPIAAAAIFAGAARAQTDGDGRYRLLGLPAGVVRVSATADGFLPRSSDLELTRGREKTGGDIHLERAARVHGQVTAGGTPIAGAEIAASRYALGGRGGELAPVGLTDGEGRFAGSVPPGRVQLFARAAGFAEARTDEFDAVAGEDREANLTLGAGGGIDGRVQDGAGHAPSGCRVQAFDAVHGRTLAEAFCDAQGQFWIRALPPAIYAVVATCAAGRGERAPVTVTEGGAAQVDIVLGAAGLAGRVVDGAGEPVAGAMVSVRVEGSAAPETAVGTTGSDGAFAASGLSGARFTVSAVAPRGRGERGGVAAGTRDVVLTLASSELVGHVEGDRAEPISDFTIYAEPTQLGEGRPRSQRFVSPSGDFRMALPPGRYSVRAGAPGFGPASAADVVVTASGGRVRLALSRGARVRGRVVDAAGQPVAGAAVASSFDMLFAYGRSAEVPNGVWGSSDAQGRFELTGVPTGRHVWVFASKEGYQQAEPPVINPTAGQELVGLVVRLKPSGGDEAREPEFGGVGLSLALRGGAVTVVDAFQGGPGREAGIRPGDVVLGVDGRPTAGMALADVVQSVRGVVGTTVVLTIRRDGREAAVPVARAVVKM